MEEVIREVTLDDISPVSAANDKVAYTTGRVDLHDVPKDRFATNFNHRLRPEVALFTDSCAFAACKNYSLHRVLISCSRALLLRCSLLSSSILPNLQTMG